MELEVRLFATLKDRVGRDRIQIYVEQPATVQDLIATIGQAYPELAQALPSALVAVNKAFAGPETALSPGDELAIFPPVSGGGSSDYPHPTLFLVTAEQVDLAAIHGHLTRPEIGAIVTFAGSVRGETRREGLPPATNYLEYEAYQEMAEEKMGQIAREIWKRWPLVKGVAIVQRIGKLSIGETTTLVAIAAGHRDQGAFEAARYGIDRLKEIVPIWKKEVGRDESVWIEGDYRPTEADND
ncbi:MAG: molybdenum cofactor biosynthesis protein MoaE [Chloroflexota bacterium]|nr:MAG: molybdenum cofactor biosynthesis protein MoaE [Chloroflexota bacterium]